jgi:dethiobiotin synthetase
MHMPENALKIPPGFFVTGTDTGIGKTFVSRLLIDAIIDKSSVTYFKPVQTGCIPHARGDGAAPDFEYVLQGKLRPCAEYGIHVPYRFKAPCSPHLAGRLEGRDISFDRIKDCLGKLQGNGGRRQAVVVEGAGGVYAPVSEDKFMIDLMAFLGLPVILVVSPRLGTINHTMLSLAALRGRRLRLAGVVMNNAEGIPADYVYNDNREFISERIRPAPLLELGFNAGPSRAVEDFCEKLVR